MTPPTSLDDCSTETEAAFKSNHHHSKIPGKWSRLTFLNAAFLTLRCFFCCKQGSYHTWSAGWCSAQRIKNLMIAGGNHTLIHMPPPYRRITGVHKKFSILFVQTVLYYYQRAPGWADPGRYKKKYAMDFAGRKTTYQTIQGQRGWRWPLGIFALFYRSANMIDFGIWRIFCPSSSQ